MKDLIKIGIPSKGRLRKDILNIFKKKKNEINLKFEDKQYIDNKTKANKAPINVFQCSILNAGKSGKTL